jgi:hypothetical protein
MNTGQMLQTIGALGLLSLLILNANRAVLGNTRTVYTGQYATTAISIAQSYVLEATVKEYDNKTIGLPLTTDVAKFSTILGPETGETSIGKFNDVDDYNGYAAMLTMPTDPLTGYNVSMIVEYVDENDYSVVRSSPTFYKRITVSVTVPYADPALFQGDGSSPKVSLSIVVSYH